MPEKQKAHENDSFEKVINLKKPISNVLQSEYSEDADISVSYYDRYKILHYITPRASDHVMLSYRCNIDGRRKKITVQAQCRRNLYIGPDSQTYEGVGIFIDQTSDQQFKPTQGCLFFITEDNQVFSENGLSANTAQIRKYQKIADEIESHFDQLRAEAELSRHPD